MDTPRTDVVVVGSANLDTTIVCERLPLPGETVLASSSSEHPGGKGLNQAIAAAARATVSLIARLGSDDAALHITRAATHARIDVPHVPRSNGPTGRALILLSEGENSIVVTPSANAELTPEQVVPLLDELNPAVVLAQLEVPLETVHAAAGWAHQHEVRFVLNPSPFPTGGVPEAVLCAANPLVVNETEARDILGLSGAIENSAEAARALAQLARSVVITLGARGVVVCDEAHTVSELAGERVRVRDSTGAGDCFAGTLAAELAQGASLVEAAHAGNTRAAALVQLARSDR